MGQKPSAERCFSYLCEKHNIDCRIIAAVSNQDAESVWWKSNSIYNICKEKNILFFDNKSDLQCEISKSFSNIQVDAVISVHHPWILKQFFLENVQHRAFNLHFAKLPDYRGCNSCNHAILNDEKTYAVTIHRMKKLVDTGERLFEDVFPIHNTDTAISLYNRATERGVELFKKLVHDLCHSQLPTGSLITGKGNYYSRDSIDSMREITDIGDIEEIDRKARAFHFPPFEPAYFQLAKGKYYIIPGSFTDSEND